MEEIWTTKDYKQIKVKDMTTKHIQNTIKAIEEGRICFTINLGWFDDNDFQVIDENVERKEHWLYIFYKELERRSK